MFRCHIFLLLDSFSVVSWAPGPVFMFCDPELILGVTEGDGSNFHVLRSWTHFGRDYGRRVPLSCFVLPYQVWAEPRSLSPVVIFCALELIFRGTEGVVSHFHVLRSRTYFGRNRGRRVPFSYFALPKLVLGGTMGTGSHFHVLRSRTRVRRYRARQVPFSCFALPDSFWAVPRALGRIFIFRAPEPVLGGTKGPGSSFHDLRSRTHFRQYRGRRVPFLCFLLLYSFSTVPLASRPLFMFVLRDSIWAVPRASHPEFMFCAPELIFGGTEVIRSHFLILRSWSHFRRYRQRRVPFSFFALTFLFSTVPSLLGSPICCPKLGRLSRHPRAYESPSIPLLSDWGLVSSALPLSVYDHLPSRFGAYR
jgi:hypothetical protein